MTDWYVFKKGGDIWAIAVEHRDQDGFQAMIDVVKPDYAAAVYFKKEKDALDYAEEMFTDHRPNPRKEKK